MRFVASKVTPSEAVHTDDILRDVHGLSLEHGEPTASTIPPLPPVTSTVRPLRSNRFIIAARPIADSVPLMRIVAGTAGGRNVVTLDGDDVRPTKDRVREAIFNSLNSYGEIEDRTFLDMFAGSGALGLEALSRGAVSCTFIDNDRRSISTIEINLDQLGFAGQAVVRQSDGMLVAGSMGPHDVALLDPPYGFDRWTELLSVVPAVVVVIESDRRIEPGPEWRILKEKQYSGTFVVIARRKQGDTEPADKEDGTS